MSDGLLSIKERKTHDPNSEAFRESNKHRNSLKKFNPYKYVSPNLVNNSPVKNILKLLKFSYSLSSKTYFLRTII